VKLGASIWSFIAGDSRFAPLAVALAVGAALLLLRAGVQSPLAGVAFAGIIACGLAAAVFERV
jgi:hypothetical protein